MRINPLKYLQSVKTPIHGICFAASCFSMITAILYAHQRDWNNRTIGITVIGFIGFCALILSTTFAKRDRPKSVLITLAFVGTFVTIIAIAIDNYLFPKAEVFREVKNLDAGTSGNEPIKKESPAGIDSRGQNMRSESPTRQSSTAPGRGDQVSAVEETAKIYPKETSASDDSARERFWIVPDARFFQRLTAFDATKARLNIAELEASKPAVIKYSVAGSKSHEWYVDGPWSIIDSEGSHSIQTLSEVPSNCDLYLGTLYSLKRKDNFRIFFRAPPTSPGGIIGNDGKPIVQVQVIGVPYPRPLSDEIKRLQTIPTE